MGIRDSTSAKSMPYRPQIGKTVYLLQESAELGVRPTDPKAEANHRLSRIQASLRKGRCSALRVSGVIISIGYEGKRLKSG